MTMPHLMNCGHDDRGWCLDCVKVEWERREAELAAINARIGDAYLRAPETEVPATGDDLLDRLNGVYTLPVNDGAGPLNGSMTFTRRFPTLRLNLEAAAEIVRLRALALSLADRAQQQSELLSRKAER